jgi:hypothetical protein
VSNEDGLIPEQHVNTCNADPNNADATVSKSACWGNDTATSAAAYQAGAEIAADKSALSLWLELKQVSLDPELRPPMAGILPGCASCRASK